MKTKLFIVLLALIGLSTVSCQKTENSPPQPQYYFMMEVVDQNGQNAMSEIEPIIIPNSTGVFSCLVYNKKVEGQLELRKYLANNTSYFMSSFMFLLPIDDCPKNVSMKIKCKELFGDEQIHAIESKWERDNQSYCMRCTSFELEGKTYTPQLKDGVWTARVVVNR